METRIPLGAKHAKGIPSTANEIYNMHVLLIGPTEEEKVVRFWATAYKKIFKAEKGNYACMKNSKGYFRL